MSEKTSHRRPATFKLDDPGVIVLDPDDSGRPARGTVQIPREPDPPPLPVPIDSPELPRAHASLRNHADDIIDGADTIKLAERELMSALDQEARRLVSSAAQRVSIVTAVSPRALFDVLFVLVASLRMIRQLARLYGGRPGTLGMIRLIRHVIGHLAITGGMAASHSLIQQMLGHRIAAKLSPRLRHGP